MIQIRVTIPDRLAKLLDECELEESEIIIQALDKFFINKERCIDTIQWKSFIESKLIDLQNQIDAHRNSSGNHDTVLDSNVTKRGNGLQDPLAISTPDDIRATTPSIKVKKIESTLSDFEIPL